ncbi:response regulator transcription factor [Pseudalkalibacillus sp. SCS-8]|uniref:response regulator transcription factor n=1 Tax=Pseudalkalibacillus nanhaiensis TaxID=3115291 RepID=UPI0032DB8E38
MPVAEKMLIVEDDFHVAQFIQLEMEHEGYTVDLSTDGEEALKKVREDSFDLIILDWMLPSLSGLEVCRRIRKSSQIPIILLTAREDIGDKIAGLDTGADDYITKPFEIEELLARIRALLRRHSYSRDAEVQEDHTLSIEGLSIDIKKRMVKREGKAIELTQREFDLLVYMMRHEGEVLNREQILSAVWGYDFVGETNVVDVYIRYLRNKLDRNYERPLIHTVRGVGYTLRSPEESS